MCIDYPKQCMGIVFREERVKVLHKFGYFDALIVNGKVARLQDAGYRVIEASNGSDGLDRFRQHPEIDLLFTDIVMPGGMMGDELAKAVRALRPDVKILFTSGYAEPSIAGRELAEAGSWLKKPYTAKELAARVRELLD